MSLRKAMITNEIRLAVIRELIRMHSRETRAGAPGAMERQNVLKSLAAELEKRMNVTPARALSDIEGQLRRIQQIRGPQFQDPGQLAHLGMLIIQHWPILRAAMETYREASTHD